jgi:hypothetical protein
MTLPIHSEEYLQSLPLPSLKEIAKQLGTKPVVDARFKKTWVLVILRKQSRTVELVEMAVELTAIDPEPEYIEPIDESIDTPAEELSTTSIDALGDKPIEIVLITPIDAHTENLSATSIEVLQHTPTLIPILVIALVLLMSIVIVPILVVSSIALVLGHPHQAQPRPQSIGSTS